MRKQKRNKQLEKVNDDDDDDDENDGEEPKLN
jgi:hypothetical protein